MARRCSSYTEFWPVYLHEHGRAATRSIHFFGTALALLALIVALATQTWWLLIVVPFAGYGPAWFAHFFVEHNRPATFTHPWWSLISDFRMFFMWCAGQLDGELKRIDLPPRRHKQRAHAPKVGADARHGRYGRHVNAGTHAGRTGHGRKK